MKKIFSISILWVALLLTGCTTNDGDIGIWFGTWTLEATATGSESEGLSSACYIQFQGDVVKVECPGEHHERFNAIYGSWEENVGTVTWLFPDSAMPMLPIPGLSRENHLTIVEKSSKKVVLTSADATFTLTKLY